MHYRASLIAHRPLTAFGVTMVGVKVARFSVEPGGDHAASPQILAINSHAERSAASERNISRPLLRSSKTDRNLHATNRSLLRSSLLKDGNNNRNNGKSGRKYLLD